ncbi:MAG: sigma-54-dependent Fis family transcriptional regulator [Desulfobacterales bacterium]|uniref:Sigma-54-dependent Fis family transcriptional regulator n=1 Tax=Candidatus Desulfatibia profunda TaxID=2841695 RepID=A0A8J6NP03_9BACT|nr:sigma-54-dependent Fis family transcriptional regulator [Candidatus Desulfatibia profunda]MBL7179236.1 sigma-54-dependent Fis family transcriptional regulator [Desulfobacterales bacterium]
MRSALVVSNEPEVIKKIYAAFRPEYHSDKTADRNSALEILEKKRYDLVFIDLKIFLESIQGTDYTAALQPFKLLYPSIEIIVMSSQDMIREMVKAVKAGASDYLTYPIDPDEVRLVAETINESILKQSELDYLRDKFWRSDSLKIIHTNNAATEAMFKKVRSVAPTKTTVLLSGETGTGKSVVAKLIHRHSNRENAQFISVHCGAIPDTLLESELFGHEKGAFTGAVRKKLGKFEIARGGTLFLDEIGTITPSAQIKLLQVLQDGTFSRVGGEETIATNARVIAATNSDLKKMCEDGHFRKDLYYRLNVFPIEIPPLRERIEDFPLLISFFLKKLNNDFQKNILDIHPHVIETLKKYAWPGNIRELENLLERAYILETTSMLTPESFPGELFEKEAASAVLPIAAHLPLTEARQKAIKDFERQYLKELISRNKGKINKSAEEAEVSTRQLHKLMLKYGIRKEDFKAHA